MGKFVRKLSNQLIIFLQKAFFCSKLNALMGSRFGFFYSPVVEDLTLNNPPAPNKLQKFCCCLEFRVTILYIKFKTINGTFKEQGIW
uniref:Uncharacterized protein n=1 Tax=Lepeophtheirus salmonis TaxID=72036 RepID=A0A0K2VB21_LEPSM